MLEKGKKQAEAAKADVEMRHQQQASDIAAMRKELNALQSVFKTIQHQQQVAAMSSPDIMIKHLPFANLAPPLHADWVNLFILRTMHVSINTHMLQTDHDAIGQLSTGKPQQSLAVEAKGAAACEDCSAAQRAVAAFRLQLEVLEAAIAVRDSKQAQSLASTQDHSGDTNDDRYGIVMSAAALQIIFEVCGILQPC